MRQVNLPPGCESLKMQDGSVYNGRPGGRVTVADHHGDAIARTLGGDAGLVGSGRFALFLGTRKGRVCEPCRRVWQVWSKECPRCGAPTVSTDPDEAAEALDDAGETAPLSANWLDENPGAFASRRSAGELDSQAA